MTAILSIKDGQCEVANQQEFSAFVEYATSVLKKSMKDAYKNLPFDYQTLAENFAEKMFTKENLCRAFAVSLQMTDSAKANTIRKKFLGNRATPETAQNYGVIAYREKIKLTDSCPLDYVNNEEFKGNPTCEDVKKSIKGRQVPVTMYMSPLSPSVTRKTISKNENAKFFTNPSTVITECESNGQRAKHFEFPVLGAINLEYIIGSVPRENYDFWYSLNTCSVNGKNYETDLLFDYGARLFLSMPVEKDGETFEATLVLATLASSHPSSVVRDIAGENKPFFGFVAGDISRLAFLYSLKHRE